MRLPPYILHANIRCYICNIIAVLFFYCRKNTSIEQSSKTFKKQREENRKAAEASGDTRAWNSLFMRPDTVCCLKLNNVHLVVLIIWALLV